ncbi:MAG: HAD-IC family P-type ATPase [Bacteroidales bacterium]|nr:HAD-IC family P-type ATPase [Bacteroidales bacterium]
MPLGVILLNNHAETVVTIDNLVPGNRILIRNQEIVPADSMLKKGKALIDYSFITGESSLIEKYPGEEILAGGKQTGEALELEVKERSSLSYLASAWAQHKQQPGTNMQGILDKVSQYFTVTVIAIALTGLAAWMFIDTRTAFEVFTAVLIVACPCALALSAPFGFGTLMSLVWQTAFLPKKQCHHRRNGPHKQYRV